MVTLLRSPRDHRANSLPVAWRGQWPVAGLSLPAGRHRDQHPAQHRDDLDADDLRAADLPDARTTRSALASLPVAGQPDHAARLRVPPAGPAAAPAFHQDAYAAGRDPLPAPGHLHRDGPGSARYVR